MEPLYYDVNFVNSNFDKITILKFIKFLFNYETNIEIWLIENVSFDNYNINIYNNYYYWEPNDIDYKYKNIILNESNYEKILESNVIFDLKINISNNVSLKILFCFEEDSWNNNYNCINFFYEINNYKKIDEFLLLYIWETFYKFIEIFNPEIISMWEATVPVTKFDIINDTILGHFFYINNKLINKDKLLNQKNLIYNTLTNWYIFPYLEWYHKIFIDILK